MRLPEQRDIDNAWSEIDIRLTPFAPHILQGLHIIKKSFHPEKGTVPPTEQLSYRDMFTLCDELSKIYPDTQTWQQARGFFHAWRRGKDVVVTYLDWIGISNDNGKVKLSPDWRGRPLPVEFMDLPWTLPEGVDEEVRKLAYRAAQLSWEGYQNVKEMLRIRPPGTKQEQPSMLVSSVIKEAKNISEKIRNRNILVRGISEDEVYGFENQGYTVIGQATSFSPKLKVLISEGRVSPIIVQENQIIDPNTLPHGCYCIKRNVLDGIPFPDGSVVTLSSYIDHHISIHHQDKAFRETARVSSPVGKNGRAFVSGEAPNAFPLIHMQLSLNPPITAWDAVVSVAMGLNTIQNLKQLDIPMYFREVDPVEPSSGRAKYILPATNTLITGWEPGSV